MLKYLPLLLLVACSTQKQPTVDWNNVSIDVPISIETNAFVPGVVLSMPPVVIASMPKQQAVKPKPKQLVCGDQHKTAIFIGKVKSCEWR